MYYVFLYHWHQAVSCCKVDKAEFTFVIYIYIYIQMTGHYIKFG